MKSQKYKFVTLICSILSWQFFSFQRAHYFAASGYPSWTLQLDQGLPKGNIA